MKKLETTQDKLDWWQSLEPQWQMAFNQVMLQKAAVTDTPNEEEFDTIFSHKFLRFAGPTAPYPNTDFELTNLSGLAAFDDAELISVTYHQITSLKEIAHITTLKSLFVDNNHITSLEGIEGMSALVDLYVQGNEIDTIKPVEQMPQLLAFHCCNNKLTNLEGLTEEHSDNLRFFVCLPNDGIKQREIIRVENTLGIKCRGAN